MCQMQFLKKLWCGERKNVSDSMGDEQVKADRGDSGHHDIENLQKEHSKKMEQDHEHGKK